MKIRQRVTGILTAAIYAVTVWGVGQSLIIADAEEYGEKFKYGDYLY